MSYYFRRVGLVTILRCSNKTISLELKRCPPGAYDAESAHHNSLQRSKTERVSKLLLTARVKNKTKKAVSQAIKKMLRPYKSLCKTITFDNGGEFADHASITRTLGCKNYFAKQYHSWKRGFNENTNGLLRRFFPKGMKLGGLSRHQIDEAQFLINIRPRKALNYVNSIEFLSGKRVSLMLAI